jgi:hypothetical protein
VVNHLLPDVPAKTLAFLLLILGLNQIWGSVRIEVGRLSKQKAVNCKIHLGFDRWGKKRESSLKAVIIFLVCLVGQLGFAEMQKIEWEAPSREGRLRIQMQAMPPAEGHRYFLTAAYCDPKLRHCIGQTYPLWYVKSKDFGPSKPGTEVLSIDSLDLLTNACLIGVYNPVLVLRIYEKTSAYQFNELIGQVVLPEAETRKDQPDLALDPSGQFRIRLQLIPVAAEL